MNAIDKIFTSSAIRTAEANIGGSQVSFEREALSQHLLFASSESNSVTRTLRSFIVLAKPEITLMVMISAGVASLMASASVQVIVLVHSVVGIGLLAAGASALNQYFEREPDSRMRRTARRPLPAGELSPPQALAFGVAVAFAGMLYVLLLLNALTALLGLLTLISYLFIYTPLKTRTSLCTFVGAFPGAAPVLIGWSATTNSLTLEAAALYAILFLWQFPHFYAIGWLYREDYERAGMLMLASAGNNDESITFHLILISTQLLVVASLLLTFVAQMGTLYLVAAIILGICFYYFAYHASVSASKLAAKRLLLASVIYLPLLYLFMILGRINQ
ncbi:MAG TPA: heme o synthase [Candidatus Sulfotelmatobacter sp.]|nr:heme o synthase [Candidatus Sulfotelmatobacter sp.]